MVHNRQLKYLVELGPRTTFRRKDKDRGWQGQGSLTRTTRPIRTVLATLALKLELKIGIRCEKIQ